MTEVDNISQITDLIFVGNQHSCCQLTINKFNIKGLICIDEYVSESCQDLIPVGVERLELDMEDRDEEDLKTRLDTTYSFIDKFVERNEKVLIHCLVGASRSCSLVIGYLCRKYGYNFNQAYELVLEKRSICQPNRGFVRQLKSLFP